MFDVLECSTKPTNTKAFTQPERLADLGKQSRKSKHWCRNWFQPANKRWLDTRLHVKCCDCWEHSSPPSKTCLHCPVRDPVLLEILCLNSTILFSKRFVPSEDFFWETNRILVEVMCCVVCPQPKRFWTFAQGWTSATGNKATLRQRRCQLSRGLF